MAPEESAADSISHVHKDTNNKDGAVQRRREDDELTSLSWLQDKNLLKGMKLRGGGASSKEGSERLSQTCEEELDQEELEPSQSDQQPSSLASQQSKHHPHHIPYNPKVHTRWKPPYSFSCLIFMSIENSALKALPVKEIYAWILDHFPYYRTAPLGWKNSVRHNLSLNKCFKKLDKPSSLGKGSLWTVEPKYRLNLVQALMKAPAPSHPYTPTSANNYRISSSDTEGSGKEDDERLCSNNDEMIDDVDAARAMLALKHGASINNNIGRKDKVLFGSSRNKAAPDHCYTAATLTAYRGVDDPEELRKTVEGADALLNLAGIKTGRSSTSCLATKRPFTDNCDLLQPSTKRLHIS